MIKQSIAIAALAVLAAPVAHADERPSGEAELAAMLEGRVAGEPQRCIRMIGSDNLTIIDETALVAERGDVIWVNRTADPDSLDDNDALVVRRFDGLDLCRLDRVTTIDRFGQYYTGNILLEDFVPYKRIG